MSESEIYRQAKRSKANLIENQINGSSRKDDKILSGGMDYSVQDLIQAYFLQLVKNARPRARFGQSNFLKQAFISRSPFASRL